MGSQGIGAWRCGLAGAMALLLLQAVAPAFAQGRQRAASPPGLLPGSTSRAPVEIDAKSLQWSDAERRATYTGDVSVVQGESMLRASQLRVYLQRGAEGGMLAAVSGSADIRRVEADGPVTVLSKDQVAAGDRGVYDKAAGTVTLTGGPVVLTQGPNAASGERLVYRLESRDAVLESARGRVRTHMVQQGSAAPARAAPQTSPDGILPGASSREPVQIEARKLEWFDATQRAVYSGGVSAVQGESSLRASRLTIFVQRGQGAAAPAPGPAGGGQVRRIEAAGPVTLVQKDQVATASRAIYDKAADRLELIGNVVLTQGPNVTTGPRLVYTLSTKQAVMTSSPGARAMADFTPGSEPKPEGAARQGRRR